MSVSSILEGLSYSRKLELNEGKNTELEKGKTYVSKIDIPYVPSDESVYYGFSEKFIKKYTKKFMGRDYIYFPKGTKYKFKGYVKGTMCFEIDGESVDFGDFYDVNDDEVEISAMFNILK